MLKGKVISVAAGKATIQFDDNQSLKVDSNHLKDNLNVPGSEVAVYLIGIGESADQNQARDLLNYLLQVDTSR